MFADTSSSASPAFGADFWALHVHAPAQSGNTGAAETAPTAGLWFCPQRHGSHADFCRSEEFLRFAADMSEKLCLLVDYFRQHAKSSAAIVENDFNTFLERRFGVDNFFDTRAEIIDSIGKQSLDEVCQIIQHGSTNVETKISAIRNLASGLTGCADGAISDLVGAARELATADGGIREKLWVLKKETARAVLGESVRKAFGDHDYFAAYERDYVDTVWNRLADRYGFEKDPNSMIMAEACEEGFLKECMARLDAALTPDRLARAIAETCLGQFNSQFPTGSNEYYGTWTPEIQQKFEEKLREIGEGFGLATEDEFRFDAETQTWKTRPGDIRIKSFLNLEDKDGGATYAFRGDPSLIALDVLRAMSALKLLRKEDRPQNKGQWTEKDGVHAALFIYGELAWVARAARPSAYEEPLWACEGVELELPTLSDLLQWRTGRGNDEYSPPAATVFHAISAASPERLVEIPPRWLADSATIEQLLKNLGKDAATAYLNANLSSLGVGFPEDERERLLACILRMGMGKAIPALVQLWSSDPMEHTDMVYELLRKQALPGFHRAMSQPDAKAAVHAWYEPLRESTLLRFAAPRLTDLLGGHHGGYSAISHACGQTGYREAPITAVYAILKDLLADPHIQSHMKDGLPELLLSIDWNLSPALSYAMTAGKVSVVHAFYAGLKDLLTAPYFTESNRAPLVDALPALLMGRERKPPTPLTEQEHKLPATLAGQEHNLESGLKYALWNGHVRIIQEFHAVLKDLLSVEYLAPRIRLALPHMLAARGRNGTPGVEYARRNKYHVTIKAFHAILADPAIRPYIGEDLLVSLMGEDAETVSTMPS